MESDTLPDTSTVKKTPLEELSKEDLIKKCKTQLAILQKAKQSKDAILKENDDLKQKLNNIESSNYTFKELIDNLTQQKLELITNLESVKCEKNSLNETLSKSRSELILATSKINEITIENESYTRRISRLNDENEELITTLQELENKIKNLEKISIQQQEQLLQVEKNETSCIKTENELKELKQQFNLKLEELLNLQSEKETIQEQNNTLKNSLTEKDEYVSNINQQLHDEVKKNNELNEYNKNLSNEKEQLIKEIEKLKLDVCEKKTKIEANENAMDDLNTEFHKNRALLESLQKDLEKTNNKLSNNQIFSSGIASDLENSVEKLKDKLKYYDTKIIKFAEYVKQLKQDKNNILIDFKSYIEQVKLWRKKLESFANNLVLQIKSAEKEKIELKDFYQNKITNLLTENENLKKKATLTDSCMQTDELKDYEKINNTLKRENSELLLEMNEMNQVLKERGETISKQQTYCDEIIKKLHEHEIEANKHVNSITQKDETIKKLLKELENSKESNDIKHKDDLINQLRVEIEEYKEKLNASFDAESETMSTSTISRTEDICRIKDLESSWEERYGKLRNLALKLKGKIRELSSDLAKEQNEKNDLQQKLVVNIKTTQLLQTQCDKLQDELDKSKSESKLYLKEIDVTVQEISKDKQQLASNDETLTKLRAEIDSLIKDKHNTEIWKKQVSVKVQSLKKELEANSIQKKDYESQIDKLKKDINAKEESLRNEIEKHKQTKNMLQEINSECKKKSVLNLEMQDYERSVKELSQKLEKKEDLIKKLKNQLEAQKNTATVLREQNSLLEESVQNETLNLSNALMETKAHAQKIIDLEQLLVSKDDKIQTLSQTIENVRSENEELSTELSKVIAEHQKTNTAHKIERDNLRSQNLGLEQKIREIQENLKLKEDELKIIENEYQSYKVRAQSVLRQNQSRDVGLEEKLQEEAASLKAQIAVQEATVQELKSTIADITKTNEKLHKENDEIVKECIELKSKIQQQQSEHEQLITKHQQTIAENNETVRGLKVHTDTLVQCYRQQISEQEVRHNREVIELQSKLDKAPIVVMEQSLLLPSMPREEGEGSESVESSFQNNTHPLEKLLGDDNEQELIIVKKQLNENESKVAHLTAILADTEQDLAKHVQMNKLLKEEIRRQQRSVEREKHAENLEYLKNVVFKFLTLGTGDERLRLIPVLNTILKLSPEETCKLNEIAKGDSSFRGWTNYLPLSWPNQNK